MSSAQTFTKWTIIFVLGGPGSGKGTQCSKLAAEYPIAHLSIGDILREEQEKPGSKWGEVFRRNILEGVIGPPELAVSLIAETITEKDYEDGMEVFVLDGFPRHVEHIPLFEFTIGTPDLVLFLDCPEEVLQDRLLVRGKMTGRVDDNITVIGKRFKVFKDMTMPVIEHFGTEGKVSRIDATKDEEAVSEEIRKVLEERFGRAFGKKEA
ncbi:related to Probable uridylate kinase [Rhynchosporium secalis]|uniref:Related to Probable uridylate kinase n=1 Tax=Rhynchosporium secalis TaxID=38038 RepID=A0A1E1MAZ3_RHYSE|nr:related to Probable uridylate kinase [Rhynchosporium secalis]